jgi:uncharacterized membrane protein
MRAMTGSLWEVIIAALAFVGLHAGSSTKLRPLLVDKLGERAFLGLFSLLSILFLVWLGFAYGAASYAYAPLWDAGNAGRWIAIVLMAVAFVFLVGALTSPGPTAVGAEKLIGKPASRRGFNAITRHPMLWSFAIWALAHLINNGDWPSIVLFGSLGGLALAGTRMIDAKRRHALGAAWNDFAGATSNIPFAAILGGRATLHWQPFLWRVPLGLVAFAAILHLHALLFGVSPFPY